MAVAVGIWEADTSRAMRGEEFAAFVEARRDRAVRLAFRLIGGDEAAAEDVVQDAFVRAYRALGGFRGDASLDTWFYRILVREAQRYRRWRALRRLWSAETAPDPADETPAGDPGLRRRIAAALERLSAAQREAFVLVHMEGLTVVEAAAVRGRAPGTLKSHLHRALGSLRRDLADLASEKEGERWTRT